MTRQLLFLMNAEQAEAFVHLLAAAERGDGAAACRLGDMYREGAGGLRYSPKQAYRWYAKSALTGDANGQNNLGACYEHGIGCAQSYPKAVKWYRLAAAQECGTASMNLGYCYLNGHGVAGHHTDSPVQDAQRGRHHHRPNNRPESARTPAEVVEAENERQQVQG